jgi:hypothetical protein
LNQYTHSSVVSSAASRVLQGARAVDQFILVEPNENVQPILAAIDAIAAHCDSYWLPASLTMHKARSMTSGEYLGWFFMTPFSQQWSLYKTRGDSGRGENAANDRCLNDTALNTTHRFNSLPTIILLARELSYALQPRRTRGSVAGRGDPVRKHQIVIYPHRKFMRGNP